MCSRVRFSSGGGTFLRGLLGEGEGDRRGSCIAPGRNSYAVLNAEIRRWDSGSRLLESSDLVAEGRRPTLLRRARAYFGFIVEWIARGLAGICLEHGRDAQGRLELVRNRCFALSARAEGKRWELGITDDHGQRKLEFALVLLGNGSTARR